MGEELHSINGMRNMEVINIKTGEKLGFIKDLKIDADSNKIISIILPGQLKSWFGKEDEKEIKWKEILRIGIDVILVDIESKQENNADTI